MRWRDAKKQNRKIEKEAENNSNIYGKFLARSFAMVMDMFMIILPINLLIGFVFGFESLENPETSPIAGIVQMLLLVIITIVFWKNSGQTPGKKAFNLEIVDSKTFKSASIQKLTVRYFSYFISLISIIGFFMPLFRKDKKALHDIISGTAVIVKVEN